MLGRGGGRYRELEGDSGRAEWGTLLVGGIGAVGENPNTDFVRRTEGKGATAISGHADRRGDSASVRSADL